MSLGSFLKFGRNNRKMTRKQLAEMVGANISSISKYEKAGEPGGHFPPIPMLAKITRALDMSSTDVFAMACEDPDDRDHFLTAAMSAQLPLIQTLNWFESISGSIDAEVEEARNKLKSSLPMNTDRELLKLAIKREFPDWEESVRYEIEPFFFGDVEETENGPNLKDSSRPELPKSPLKAVGAASTKPKKGKE